MKSHRTLVLPGWQGSCPAHWQSRWELLHGYERVQQHDWQHPLRGDWTARLEEVVLDSP
ncbi:MAG: alpha/beta hydrolase, partial [Simplicispira sp.]|nr:alpha/beta hydrolase [Simplicispira sp.]